MDQKTSILKTWKKFRKPRRNLQKAFGNPVYILNFIMLSNTFKKIYH